MQPARRQYTEERVSKSDVKAVDATRLSAEALRLFGRYQLEIVEHFRLCPWADRARREGAVETRVLQLPDPRGPEVLPTIQELATHPRTEIGILLFPRCRSTFDEFERFAAVLRELDQDRWPLGHAPFAIAAFHPAASADTRSGERLIPFLRRTPDPTLQLVRLSALEKVRAGDTDGTQFVDLQRVDFASLGTQDSRSLRERIATNNLETVRAVGVEAFCARLDDIAQDRSDSYAKLGI